MTHDIGVSVHYNEQYHYTGRLSQEVRMVIEKYTPRLAHAEWLPVADFVRETVARCAPGSVDVTREALGLVARLCTWGARVGLPSEVEALFDPDVIERFLHDERMLKSPTTVADASGRLMDMSRLLLSTSSSLTTITRKPTVQRPYTEGEEPLVRSWAAQQPSARKRRAASAVLGFSRGAGLRRDELGLVLAGDVTWDAAGPLIQIRGANPRLVPIDERWVDDVIRAIDGLEPDAHPVFPNSGEGRMDHLHLLSGNRKQMRVRSTRLRSTWICDRLDRLPASVLVQAAGFTAPQALNPYYRLATPLSAPDLVSELRARA